MTPSPRRAARRPVRASVGMLLLGGLVAGCGGVPAGDDPTTGQQARETTVTNCGREADFPTPAEGIYVNDGNMTAMLLELGAQDQIGGVAGLERHRDVLSRVYGKGVVDALPEATEDRPTLENVIAQRPDVVVAGWSYGYSTKDNLTPASLREHGIAPYVLTESCRRGDGARGTMPPWEALEADLVNLGEITGRQERAEEVVSDIAARRASLEKAPSADEKPTVFLFDSGTKEVLTSGAYGGPQAIIEAAGARNATADVKDTWTSISWERIATAEPDVIAFVDYPGQSYEQKVEVLKQNPATKDLPAVKHERFVNLPYAAWTSSPLNIDAAENLRVALEEEHLLPASDVEPDEDLVRGRTGD